MIKVGRFEKVSYEQFHAEVVAQCGKNRFSDEDLRCYYEELKLPERKTVGSAGYDFHAPFDFEIPCGRSFAFPTGVRCKMDKGWFLALFPRSGLGFQYRMRLDNTVGIIDSDYSESDNEGQMMAKFSNDSHDGKPIVIKRGEAYMQGIFIPYGITTNDMATGLRNGGFGSTDKSRRKGD